MSTVLWSLALSFLVATPATSATSERFGGWASITVDKLPDQVVAGRGLEVVFVVKQHGKTPLSGLKPTLEAKGAAPLAKVTAVAGTEKGQYKATLNFAQAGEYFITIHSGFGDSRLTLPAITVVTAAGDAPSR